MHGAPVTLSDFIHNMYLVHLSLVDCGISTLPVNVSLPNIQTLDLSHNQFTALDISKFHRLTNMKVLRLGKNPIVHMVNKGVVSNMVKTVDLSENLLELFESRDLAGFPNITHLNLSYSRIHTISTTGFQVLPELVQLDLRGCPLKNFTLDVFEGLRSLINVYSPDYRLC
jgi:Leucine-rich repeat (LRR) protein